MMYLWESYEKKCESGSGRKWHGSPTQQRSTNYPWSELQCNLFWATMHPASYTAPCELNYTLWATLHPVIYAPPHWAELYSNKMYWNPTELPCTLLSTPTQPPSYWAMLQPIKLCCTFSSMLHLTKLRCTLQCYAAHHRAMLHLTELHCTPLSYAVPHGAI
jgi:hypothetical protein